MRTFSLISLSLAASLAAFAATSHDAVYSVGDLDGISAGAKGVVRADENTLTFHSGKLTVEMPYSKVIHMELGQRVARSTDTKHRFWELNKKTEHQTILVNFKDAVGKDQSMTLELTEADALDITHFVNSRTGVDGPDVRGVVDYRSSQGITRQEEAEWWGDRVWRTDHNSSSWNTETASAK
jgi:hypothetical protein